MANVLAQTPSPWVSHPPTFPDGIHQKPSNFTAAMASVSNKITHIPPSDPYPTPYVRSHLHLLYRSANAFVGPECSSVPSLRAEHRLYHDGTIESPPANGVGPQTPKKRKRITTTDAMRKMECARRGGSQLPQRLDLRGPTQDNSDPLE